MCSTARRSRPSLAALLCNVERQVTFTSAFLQILSSLPSHSSGHQTPLESKVLPSRCSSDICTGKDRSSPTLKATGTELSVSPAQCTWGPVNRSSCGRVSDTCEVRLTTLEMCLGSNCHTAVCGFKRMEMEKRVSECDHFSQVK